MKEIIRFSTRYSVATVVVCLMWSAVMSAYGAEIFEMPAPKEGDRWEFKASTKEGITSTTDVLDGIYEVELCRDVLKSFKWPLDKRPE